MTHCPTNRLLILPLGRPLLSCCLLAPPQLLVDQTALGQPHRLKYFPCKHPMDPPQQSTLAGAFEQFAFKQKC
jgi:hypothetical protein